MLGVRKVFFIFYFKERIENSLKMGKMAGYVIYWKVENFLCSTTSLTHDKRNNFFVTSYISRDCRAGALREL